MMFRKLNRMIPRKTESAACEAEAGLQHPDDQRGSEEPTNRPDVCRLCVILLVAYETGSYAGLV